MLAARLTTLSISLTLAACGPQPAGPVKVPVGEIVTIGATVLDADGLPVPAARARPAPRSTPSKRLKPTPRRAICMCSR